MNKKLMLTVLMAWCTLAIQSKDIYVSTSFHEPATEGLRFIYSYDGLRWDSIQGTFLLPKVGKQKVMRDPSIVRGPDGTFHLVWTSSWRGDRGFGYASSKDLIHWSEQRFIEVMKDTTTVNVWAPELFYDDVKKQYLIVWASCIPGKFPDYQEDHKNNHRLYYTTTKDFKRFSETKLFYDPDFSDIDATLVKRGKNDYVMVVKDNSRPMRNIKVAFATSPYGPWGKASEPFTESFTEGPSTAKVGDWWYIYYDSYRHKIYGAHRTKDFIHFQDQTGAVNFPVGHKHGTVFMAPEELVQELVKYNRDVVHYSGKTIARPERHDGGLKPVVGVHSIQTMRGEKPWTYNHQPMLTHWNGKFYMHYITNPRHEHEPPGKTMMQTSEDGYTWTAPTELFPEYQVPNGFKKASLPDIEARDVKAVMHQRVGFYVAPNDRLIAIGNYGIVLTPKDDPNDGNGIGRVVREIKKDGTLGPIYFVYYNHDFNEHNTDYPYYKRSKDKGFVKAVDALIADPMQRMQWVEEADRNDPLIPLQRPYKAFSGYTLPDGRKVALWKHAVTSISTDGGNTWREPCYRAPGFVNSNAKIWGQRLSDGTYATVYNPAEYRWPLAISLSNDGLNYTTLSLINGEVTPLRHGGNYKSYGPQYVRGIFEGGWWNYEGGSDAAKPQDKRKKEGSTSSITTSSSPIGDNINQRNSSLNHHPSSLHNSALLQNSSLNHHPSLWLTYSNNKEDIWVSRVPVPVRLNATSHADKSFEQYRSLAEMTDWNIYSPRLAPVRLTDKWMVLEDSDPYDYAKLERVIPNTKELEVEFDLNTGQNDYGSLNIEFVDDQGTVCSRIVIDSTNTMKVKGGARYGTILKHYEKATDYHIKARLSVDLHHATYYLNGKKACERQFDTPVESISRIVFRTGSLFDKPDIKTPADQDFDMERADEKDKTATYRIANVVTRSLDADSTSTVLKYEDYAHYADYFNTMEDENIVTTIPNAQSSEWLSKNIPLFDCPHKDFEEMYYYRWWTLRKHIKRTPVGYGMTEFLVPRSYADRYNLIACAIGHHVMESRWLRDTTYLHQILRTWYYGNDGQPMTKMNKFSSWNPAAILEAWKVLGNTDFLLGLKPRLEDEYARWESTNRLPNGLYWQGDVQDGMEESISGGRKKQYARPTINSYMFGNAKALAFMNHLTGETDKENMYQMKADTLRHLVEDKLWNEKHQFFETMRGDTLAAVREAIGFIPWYFNLPQGDKYDVAWQQLLDEKGFSAPYGLTTAERRHPEFRSHGVGRCEWDGAVWPFATSQTLTALGNYLDGRMRNDDGGSGAAKPQDKRKKEGSTSSTTTSPSPIGDNINHRNSSINHQTSTIVIQPSTFYYQMERYVESQHHRGRPYIGEYLDEKNGAWLMGDRERSRYYNHSTFNDLIITGIVGLRPQADHQVVINPLLPNGEWKYFCLDGVNYHGHVLTIIWDEDGQRYHQGKGLMLMVDGEKVACRKDLGPLTFDLN